MRNELINGSLRVAFAARDNEREMERNTYIFIYRREFLEQAPNCQAALQRTVVFARTSCHSNIGSSWKIGQVHLRRKKNEKGTRTFVRSLFAVRVACIFRFAFSFFSDFDPERLNPVSCLSTHCDDSDNPTRMSRVSEKSFQFSCRRSAYR